MEKSRSRTVIHKLPEWIIEKFKTFKWKNWLFYCILLFLIGRIIDHATQNRFSHFLTHQILLITATTMLVCAMKMFFLDIDKLNCNGSDGLLKNPEARGFYLNKLLPILKSFLAPAVSLVITVFFFSCIIMLEYIELDSIGIYAVYIAGSSVLIGAYGYVQYLCFLWFVYQAGKLKYRSDSYNIYTPAATPWVSQIAKTSQQLRSFFLWIGLIYVIEYGILVPTDKISFTGDVISLNTPNNVAFLISWIALFFLVIIAFPIINHYQRKFVTDLVEKLKDQSVQDLSILMAEEKRDEQNKKQRMSTVITYSVIIENIRRTKSYPIKQLFGYETIMTFVTFVVHVMNLYSKIASIPQLNTVLP